MSSRVFYQEFIISMKTQYGLRFSTIFYEIKSTIKKIVELEYKSIYYRWLSSYNLLPKNIKISNKYLRKYFYPSVISFEITAFSKLKKENYKRISYSNNYYYNLLNLFFKNFNEHTSILTMYHLNMYRKYLGNTYFKKFSNKKHFLSNKYPDRFWDNPMEECQKLLPCANIPGFKNLSQISFTKEEIGLLNNGPKFTLETIKKQKNDDIVIKTDLEYLCRNILTIETGINYLEKYKNIPYGLKGSLGLLKSNILHGKSKYGKEDSTSNNTGIILKSIENKLVENKSIITTADKSNTLIVIDMSTYDLKMETALSLNNFIRTADINIEKKERKLQSLLRELLKLEAIDLKSYKNIYPSSSPPAIIDGKIKLHKPSLDIRPIVNTRNTYSYQTSKWILPKVKKYMNKTYTVKNSLELKNKLINLHITSGYYMVSLDVVSMFGSIDTVSVIEYIKTKYKFDKHKEFHIPLNLLEELLTICSTDMPCLYGNDYYVQNQGCGMGMCLSPLFADIQMWMFEKKFMSKLGKGINPIIISYMRFVDDIFLIIRNKTHASEILEYANSIFHNLKFTLEEENNGSINFLDVVIKHQETYLDFSIFRKKSQNLIRINYNSHYDYHIKINNIKSELKRAYSICSNENLLKEEINIIKQIYINNDYPLSLINSIIEQTNADYLKTVFSSKHGFNEKNSNLKYIPIDATYYFSIFSESFNRLREEGIWENLENIKLIKKGPLTFKKLLKKFNRSNVIETNLTKNVIYKYNCECQEIYIGSTLRSIKTRGKEHVSNKKSGIYIHLDKSNHTFSFSNFDIIKTQPNKLKRLTIESLYIEKLRPRLNLDSGFQLLINNF